MKIGDKLYSVTCYSISVYTITRVCPQTLFAIGGSVCESRFMKAGLDKLDWRNNLVTLDKAKAIEQATANNNRELERARVNHQKYQQQIAKVQNA